ncbi:MAG TPA: CopD family protein [Sphingomicrobium sp.]|jgi:protoporphyrinogen IX oxidase|nr:CopD family protein [Sphingomicrobium sp.]
MLWLKFLHITALSVWVAGLLYLPAMLWAHQRIEDRQDFARIRMGSRFVYMGLVSPAAFIAIGAGAALLLISDALHPWMFVKLMAVGVLVIAHMQYGHILAHLADEEAKAPTVRVVFVAAAVAASAALALWLVLAKPEVPTDFLPAWALEPGLLQRPAAPEVAPPPGPVSPPPRS